MKTYDKHEPINLGRFLADHGAKKKRPRGPHVWLDPYHGKPYKSPMSQKEVSSRHQRREEMKTFNVREVEPSESPFHRDGDRRYNSQDFAQRYQMRRFRED